MGHPSASDMASLKCPKSTKHEDGRIKELKKKMIMGQKDHAVSKKTPLAEQTEFS